MTIINATKNLFGGCIVESADLPDDLAEFEARLEYSLGIWKTEGIKVVWLAVSRAKSRYIPICISRGFVFHHAVEDNLQMTLTLVQGSFIPPYATHYIGAGGVIIDEDRNLLVVSERYRSRPGRALKLPGGALQVGEHIAQAVVREVKEETGINARFENLVCLRHWHGYRHGKSDIYFVCRLTPLTKEITMDTRELVECLWMPLDEYLADKDIHSFNKLAVSAAANSHTGLSEKFIEIYNSETYELLAP